MNQSFVERGQSASGVRRAVDRRGFAWFATATLALAVVGSGLGVQIWVRTRATEEGYRLSRLAAEHRELSRRREALQARAAELRSPPRLEELARTRLGMGPPSSDRVVLLVAGTVRPTGFVAAR